MDDNNKEAGLLRHPSVISELNELEALVAVMLTADMSVIAPQSRKDLLALAYRVISTALDKAHGRIVG